MPGRPAKFKPTWILGLIIPIAGLTLIGIVLMLLSWGVYLPGLWGFRGIPVPFVLVNTTIGALILVHQPKNKIGWLILSFGALSALDFFCEEYATYSWFISSVRLPGDQIAAWISSWVYTLQVGPLLTLLPLIFPNGKVPSARWRPLATIAWIAIFGLTLIVALNPKLEPRAWMFHNPLTPGFPADYMANVLLFLVLAGIATSSLCIGSLFYRYRSGSPIERQQIKWFLFSSAIAVALAYPALYGGVAGALLFFVAVQGVAISIGIAIVYHRLFNIDLIIRRTIVYTLLTAIVVLIYLGVVTLLQDLFASLTGSQSALAIVISTLVIAGLFNPIRRRIQNWIDRRFYRRKVDEQKALEAFAVAARNEFELEQLTDYLVETVNQTLQPEMVSIWLTSSGGELSTSRR